MNSRGQLEASLAHSLSRYIGYTTGAYGIERFVEILNLFSGKPFVYHFELVEQLKQQALPRKPEKQLTDKYSAGIVDFISALGLIRLALGARGPQVNPKLVKFELTEYGRSLRAACELGLDEYRIFLLEALLAEYDADIYCLVLEYYYSGGSTDLKRYVKSRMREVRQYRIDWIEKTIPHKFLREKIIGGVSWIESASNFTQLTQADIPDSFLRHHVTPRNGWAREVGHIDSEAQRLTSRGKKYFERFCVGGLYSWIGPGAEVMEKLKISEMPQGGVVGSPHDLIRGEVKLCRSPSSVPSEAELIEVADYMVNGFSFMKLASANQASIGNVQLYLNFIESRTGRTFNLTEVMERLIKSNSHLFAAVSSRNARLGYYQLRSPV
jgi:hypothetical protein